MLPLGHLVLAILLTLSTCAPTSREYDHRTDLSPERRNLDISEQHRSALLSPQHLGHARRSLQQRTWRIDYLDEGWALYYTTVTPFMSIQNAATTLSAFFQSVAEQATGHWAAQNPVKTLTIEMGQLALDFESDNLTAIPWNFVAVFADRMAKTVQTGFTGAFEMVLQHMVSGGVVYVKLRTKLQRSGSSLRLGSVSPGSGSP